MAELWYYTHEGKQMDPVSFQELQRLASDGILLPTDMVWKEAMPRWIRALSLPELYPASNAALDPSSNRVEHTSAAETAAEYASTQQLEPLMESVPSVKKRRRSAEGVADRSPPRRREVPLGNSNLGIFIALGLGAFVLMTALAVGVVILIAAHRDPPPVAANAPPVFQPPPLPLPPINPNNLVNPIAAYDVRNIFRNTKDVRRFSFRKGVSYDIKVSSVPLPPGPRLPLIEVAVVDSNQRRIAAANTGNTDPILHWRPQADGEYSIEISNMDLDPALSIAVHVVIRAADAPPEGVPIGGPLPDDVKTGVGSIRRTKLQPGEEFTFKLRVKAGHPAFVRVTNHTKGRGADLNLFILKDGNGGEVASDVRPDASAFANFRLEATEIVQVRLVNASKTTPSDCTIIFNGGL